MLFQNTYDKFWEEIGKSKKMVLSTSLNDKVTSRMISVIMSDKKIYFQTDNKSRKYEQLIKNSNVSLCIDNIQIDGKCIEIGTPMDNKNFIYLYKKYFAGAFARYSMLENERLFEISPTYIQRWLYINDVPFIEIFDVNNETYSLTRYIGH